MTSPHHHPRQIHFATWLAHRGIKHTWAATAIGYSRQYFSRVLTGTQALTDEFRQRCTDKLEVPDEVWTLPQTRRQ